MHKFKSYLGIHWLLWDSNNRILRFNKTKIYTSKTRTHDIFIMCIGTLDYFLIEIHCFFSNMQLEYTHLNNQFKEIWNNNWNMFIFSSLNYLVNTTGLMHTHVRVNCPLFNSICT